LTASSVRTQIGGSYRDDNVALFPLKRHLLAQGVEVRHPLGWQIVFEGCEPRGYSATDYSGPFSEVERDYYRCIADCTFHSVANTFAVGPRGHIGRNAATEIALAMMLGKAIALTSTPTFSAGIDPAVLAILHRNVDKFVIFLFDTLGADGQRLWLPPPIPQGVYDISAVDRRTIARSVKSIFESICSS
jgi:hypothetical protein